VRALGATPVHITPVPPTRPVTRRPIDGQLTSIFSAHQGTIVTANVNLPPDANTLVVNSAVLKSLTPDQRRALYDAADDLRAEFLGAGGVSEAKIVESWCKARGDANPPAHAVAIASPAELSALARATRPIYAELERDAGTSALIARIREIRSSLPQPPPLKVPATGCRPAAGRAALGRSRPPSLLNGTYRWIITKADARSKTPDRSPAGLAQWPACFEVTLRDGKWLGESCSGGTGRDVGTYSVTGRRISFQSPDRRGTFEFSIGHDRSLRLRAVGPMEPGDRFVLTTEPWRRIGPPVKAIR
jgi:hypothetical protein